MPTDDRTPSAACTCGERDAERYPDATDRVIVPSAADCPTHGVSAASSDPVAYLGHDPESVIFDGETFQIVCSCSWEGWAAKDEEEAWEMFNDHVFDDVNTALSRLRDRVKVTNLA